MKTIEYTITFHSYWHCGSGLAAGADVDALVIKDSNGLPYIPGKTIKGLVREAFDEIQVLRNEEEMGDKYLSLFGYLDDNTEEQKKDVVMKKSTVFFTNASLVESEDIIENRLQRFLYKSISQTAIDKDGIAKKHCLRKMQVVVPCTLKGKIIDVPDELEKDLLAALQFVKGVGVNRSRGLGRCTINGKEVTK